MLDEVTVQKLREMHLPAMSEQFKKQMQEPSFQSMSFSERFGLIVDIEWAQRKNNRLARLIRKADLHSNDACIENIEYHADRELDKSLITHLAACGYIRDHRNIIILGATGAGKTYLACAFGMAALRNFYTVRYVRLPELLLEFQLARKDGTYRKVMNQLKHIDLLILDDWLLTQLDQSGVQDLLEIIEARHHNASTIFSSQFPAQVWHKKIGEDSIADAILDRIVYDSYTILIKGTSSMRERKGIATDTL